MNSTHWTTLTGFAKYLGKEGKAVVDETEKGWFVAYIDRDPATIARQAARDQRNAAEVDEEVRESRKIEQQIAQPKEKKRWPCHQPSNRNLSKGQIIFVFRF